MKTLEQIEKRRRQLQYLTYLIIYLLALVVFGLFFFIDAIAGFFGQLKYNIFLRLYFVAFIGSFILYIGQKEKQQSGLTKELIGEMDKTASKLHQELRRKEFLSEITYLVANLRDEAILEQLFNRTLVFLRAEGGAIVFRNQGSGWKTPLLRYPDDANQEIVDHLTKLVGKTGRPFLQPNPDYPAHRQLKQVASALAVPLRFEGRLYGLLAFWSDADQAYDFSDLDLLEFIAREAAGAASGMELMQERHDQIRGLLELLSTAADNHRRKTGPDNQKIADAAVTIAKLLGLPQGTVDAVETAALLQNVESLFGNGKNSKQAKDTVEIVKAAGFPRQVIQILSACRGLDGDNQISHLPIGAQVLAAAKTYAAIANPRRGAKPAPETVESKIDKQAGRFSEPVAAGLRDMAAQLR